MLVRIDQNNMKIVNLFIIMSLFSNCTESRKENRVRSGEVVDKNEIAQLKSIAKPQKRDKFEIDIESLEKIRVFYGADERTKGEELYISEIDESKRNDIIKLLDILRKASIEDFYVGKTPDYETNKDLKAIFLNFKDMANQKNTATIDIILANNGTSLTLREYFYANAANFYVLDQETNKELVNQLNYFEKKYIVLPVEKNNKTPKRKSNAQYEDEVEIIDIE